MSVTEAPSAYSYGLLDPRPHAAVPDTPPERILGIEVTTPRLTACCALGNIDPQHAGGDLATAAIEAALTHPLPPSGTLLVTVRPDLDALGAMAVLDLRAQGRPLTDALRSRVAQIAAADKAARGSWHERAPRADRPSVGALEVLGSVAFDHTLPLGIRVATIRQWLEHGRLPDDADQRAAVVRDERQAAHAQTETREVRGAGTVAVLVARHRLAFAIGYDHAPVVVAENPDFTIEGGPAHRKVTVGQYEEGWVDLGAVVNALNDLERLHGGEPGWGGSSTICGSPQGAPCQTSLDEIATTVERNLLRQVHERDGD